MTDALLGLIGCLRDSSEVQSFCEQISRPAQFVEESGVHRWYLSEYGVEIRANADGIIDTVFLFGEKANDPAGGVYPESLPYGLSFRMNRQTVRRLLGAPQDTGERQELLGLQTAAWDRFMVHGLYYHIEYAEEDDGVGMVTIYHPAALLRNQA